MDLVNAAIKRIQEYKTKEQMLLSENKGLLQIDQLTADIQKHKATRTKRKTLGLGVDKDIENLNIMLKAELTALEDPRGVSEAVAFVNKQNELKKVRQTIADEMQKKGVKEVWKKHSN